MIWPLGGRLTRPRVEDVLGPAIQVSKTGDPSRPSRGGSGAPTCWNDSETWAPLECTNSSITERERHVDGRFNFCRSVVEHVRLVAPGLNRCDGGLPQHRRSTQNAYVLDGSGLGNGRLDDDGAGDPR